MTARHVERRLAAGISLFSTCPQSKDLPQNVYVDAVTRVAQWSEHAGCEGILVYTDNSLLDPWMVGQLIIARTSRLSPLVAVQPIYMHPYTVAKLVSSIAYLTRRRVALNMVAGGFTRDLLALDDETEHDGRYARVIEYTRIITRLLAGPEPVSFDGRYYRVHNLRLNPPLDSEYRPRILLSGSSPAGLAAAAATGATAVCYPNRVGIEPPRPTGTEGGFGVRVGVIARNTDREAWRVARTRFPEDRHGQLTHALAMAVSDSHWHGQLSAADAPEGDDPYWLGPFQNYRTFCPYVVGSYDTVAEQLAGYVGLGFKTFILDVPVSLEEMEHIGEAFDRALRAVTV
ncbi:MAG: LLM class flavin-dependent oxidoreductase [Chloroflexota bacterium]|nr:LLM class flavin-dependent oxidoreductase [Chloroflexota bacterium]